MTHRTQPVERRLGDRRKNGDAVDRAFDDYIAASARELRGPLRSVLRLARVLREYDGAMDGSAREYADYIRASAEHMTMMLNDLRHPAAPLTTADEGRSASRPVVAR